MLEHNAQGTLVKDAFRAETPKQLRFQVLGNAVATTDVSYSTKLLTVDLAGKWESVSGLDEQDGDNIITATFHAAYDADADLFIEVDVVNERATLA